MEHKTYPLLPIENGYVAVEHGPDIKVPNGNFFTLGKDDKHSIWQYKGDGERYTTELSQKIIAHTGIPSLKDSGLPLIDISERNMRMEQLAEAGRAWNKIKDQVDRSVDDKTANVYWIAGYCNRAAAGGYTEEDIRNAFRAGIEETIKKIDWDGKWVGVGSTEEDDYMQSLKKHPKAVVLEGREMGTPAQWLNDVTYFEPKIVEGKVIIKEVIYD